jgi:thiol-disulfide isomerase/thioredoxin
MALLWLAMIGIGLIGCGGRALDPASSVTPTLQSGSQAVTGIPHDEIAWHIGDVDSAFAVARAEGKPVLLYWGADWCPPCSRLKATVFRHPEFVDRTRLFVAVNLDGDEPGAQRLGEQFDVSGYPTVIVLSPDREEITRISIFMEMEQYVHALDVALAATQPASAAYAAVLSGVATDSDLRLLAYYSWGQDNERLVAESQLPAALQSLEAAYPPHLAIEKSRLFMAYLTTQAYSRSGDDEVPALTGDELRRARARLLEILDDSAMVQANFLYLVYGAHLIFSLVAEPMDADAETLADSWEAALARIREDPATSAVDRIGTLNGTLCLFRVRHAAPPKRLVRAVRTAVREAERDMTDPYARMSLFSAAYSALSVAGLYDEAYYFMTREVKRSHSPDYVMLALAGWVRWYPSEALSWAERAWQEASGPATRFERGTRYVRMLVQFRPDAEVRIENTAIALFQEVSAAREAFFQRTVGSMRRLETDLREWNVAGIRESSLARIRAEVQAICDIIGDVPSRANCRTFLAEQSPEAI